MHPTAILILSLFTCFTSSAQDTIIMRNRRIVIGEIVDVNANAIHYKPLNSRFRNIIYKKDVYKVFYSNANVVEFSPGHKQNKIIRELNAMKSEEEKITLRRENHRKKLEADPRTKDYFRNYFYVDVADAFSGLMTIGYERTLSKGKTSLSFPISIGLKRLIQNDIDYDNHNFLTPYIPTGPYYYPNKIFSAGIDLNYFPVAQGTIRFFNGPSYEHGLYQFYEFESNTTGNFVVTKKTSMFFTLSYKAGVLFQPSKKINISTFLMFGLNSFTSKEQSDFYYDYGYSHNLFRYFNMKFGITAGYKF